MNTISNTWNNRSLIGFRFLFSYFVLYTIFDYISFALPYGDSLEVWLRPIWSFLVPPVGEYVFGIEKDIYVGPSGSGDSTADYIIFFIKLIFAIIATIAWSILDRKRNTYSRLKSFLFVYLRYFLGGVLISYGFAKVFTLQFSEPSLHGLVKPYGEFSPMGVLWRFMGSSTSYSIFSGVVEVVGGLLLFHRKTLRLGVLICIGVMANVVMLNFSYDVPVKLFSSHLLLIGIVLFWSDLKQYINFLVLNRPAVSTKIQPYFSKPLWNQLFMTLKVLFISLLLFENISCRYKTYINQKDFLATKLYGIHKVDDFKLKQITDSIEHNPEISMPDSIRWDKLIIHYPKFTRIYYKDNTNDLMRYEIDSIQKTMSFVSRDSTRFFKFNYHQPNIETLILNGIGKQNPHEIKMHLFPKDSFLLNKRGFNWINEYPFNR